MIKFKLIPREFSNKSLLDICFKPTLGSTVYLVGANLITVINFQHEVIETASSLQLSCYEELANRLKRFSLRGQYIDLAAVCRLSEESVVPN